MYKTKVCIVKNPVMLKEIKEDPNEWKYAVFTDCVTQHSKNISPPRPDL